MKLCAAIVLSLAALSSRVHADDAEIDVRSFEYVDVIATTDGSVWKGIVTEQEPNVQYKIATADGSVHVIKAGDVVKLTKQRNRDYRGGVASAPAPIGSSNGTSAGGVSGNYQPGGSGLPPSMATTGGRLGADFTLVFPAGDISQGTNTSFSPTVHAGFEAMFGNFGLSGGGLARWTDWQTAGNTGGTAWLLETMAYGHAALHVSRVALFGGIALGLDTNYVGANNMSKTSLGFGMNLQTGLELQATQQLAFELGFDYHPGTDTILAGAPGSVSYYGMSVGLGLHL